MGVDQRRLQWLIVLGVGLCVGASVAAAGIISFVGSDGAAHRSPARGRQTLGDPAAVRTRWCAPVLLADSLVRLAPTVSELRLGIAMAMLGGPFFLVMLIRMHRQLA